MTPRGGPTLDFSLFGRYFLDLAVFYPGAFLCLAPLWEHVKAPRRTAVLAATLVTAICLAAAALCAIFELDSNILLLPTLLAAFWLLRWRVGPEVSVSQTAFLFAVSGVMTAVCTLLSTVLNARAEVGNDAPACLVSTSLLKLGLSAVLCIIFWFTAVQWSRWLLREYRGEAFWQSAWPLPTIYAAFLVFCMPLDPAVVLINRLMIISVLAVTISLLGIFLLLYEMYQVAREYTRSAQLDRENQLLAVESRRYTELRTYMEQTRHLRHDFRQHLHVIAGLTEAGQVDELKNYLHQYESELSEERPTLCANPAVDALAGHYDHEAHSLGVPVDWRLELPRQLAPAARADCLLSGLFHGADTALPPKPLTAKVVDANPFMGRSESNIHHDCYNTDSTDAVLPVGICPEVNVAMEKTNPNASPAIFFDNFDNPVSPFLGGLAIRDLDAEEVRTIGFFSPAKHDGGGYLIQSSYSFVDGRNLIVCPTSHNHVLMLRATDENGTPLPVFEKVLDINIKEAAERVLGRSLEQNLLSIVFDYDGTKSMLKFSFRACIIFQLYSL